MSKKLVCIALLSLLSTPTLAKIATCQIKSADASYNGKCVFQAETGGSFAVSHPTKKTILPNISTISVSIIEPGFAEVRGLTTDGINSRWGEAHRSTKDRACWVGDDFKICAR